MKKEKTITTNFGFEDLITNISLSKKDKKTPEEQIKIDLSKSIQEITTYHSELEKNIENLKKYKGEDEEINLLLHQLYFENKKIFARNNSLKDIVKNIEKPKSSQLSAHFLIKEKITTKQEQNYSNKEIFSGIFLGIIFIVVGVLLTNISMIFISLSIFSAYVMVEYILRFIKKIIKK